MRRIRHLMLLAVAVIAALIVFAGNCRQHTWPWSDTAVVHEQAGSKASPSGASTGDDALSIDKGADSPASAVPATMASTPASGDPFRHVPKTRDNLALNDDPFGAQSRAEQQWLDRNGYPNMRQVEVYPAAPDALLLQAADAGDRVARVMLDERRLRRGDPQAEADLMAAAADGSIYALNVLAGYYGQKGPQANPAKAYSLTRVMEMLGDYKVPLTRQYVVGPPLDPVRQMQAEADALGLYRSIVQRRTRATGANHITIQPRPI